MQRILQRFIIRLQRQSLIINAPAFSKTRTRMASSSSTAEPSLQPLGVPPKMRTNPALKKIDTPEFRSIFTEELDILISLFKKYDYELRVAGGAVRDILMSKEPKDIDLATTATPNQMKEMFVKEEVRLINAKGEKHGTITPRINNKENFEVTTLRIDVITDGRHAEVQFTTDWQLDANRRDLTINSMFLGFDGTVYDYFFGYDDLQQRRVVFVGDANVRIKEDYLRILRYFRFYGRIAEDANKHDASTIKSIQNNIDGLARISGERIWAEMQKICVGNYGQEVMLQMFECEMSRYCGLPAVPNVQEFRRVCRALENFPKPHYPILYMIGLLYSYEDAIRLHERLKLSAYERDLALFITRERKNVDNKYTSLHDYKKLCVQPYAKREFVEELLKYCNKVDLYNALKDWQIPSFPVNGNMLTERGCPKSKKMGIVLSRLKLIWADGDFKLSSEELLDKFLPELLEEILTQPSSPTKKLRKSE